MVNYASHHKNGQISLKQKGQDGPGSHTWIFERTIANKFFCHFQRKKIQEFLYVRTCKYAPFPNAMLLTDQNFMNNFLKVSPKEHFYEVISKSDQWFQRRRFFKN